MVKLIPDIISPSVKSSAEKRLFNEFRTLETNQNYIVLHSLGMSEHTSNIFGEVDFVVICREGILCIEVKGGVVSRKDGIWSFTNKFGQVTSKIEGPFQQVQGNMQSLRQYMERRLGPNDPIASCQYACSVIMPDCVFAAEDRIDTIPEVLFDERNNMNLDEISDVAFEYWRSQCKIKHGYSWGRLSDEDIERAANLLRGDFQYIPSPKEYMDRSVKALTELTEEQYDVLESLVDNQRTLISGMAGSGKSILATEQARRAYWEGKHVIYLCFNHNMANYVSSQFARENIEIEATTLHAFMMNRCGISWEPGMDEYFYSVTLPQMFLDKDSAEPYDLVIVDEGQDVLKRCYIPFFEHIIRGGIECGNWTVYYDANQNIFNSNSELDKVLATLRKHSASFRLSVNCRNTKQISNANTLATNIPNARTKVSGAEVNYIKYIDQDDESRLINSTIRKLKESGISGGDFVVLSKYSLEKGMSAIGRYGLDKDLGTLKTAGNMWQARKNEVRFSTVSSFKGLEAKIILLTDVDRFSDELSRLLNYVAISRAEALLYIFYDQNAESDRQKMIASGFGQIL